MFISNGDLANESINFCNAVGMGDMLLHNERLVFTGGAAPCQRGDTFAQIPIDTFAVNFAHVPGIIIMSSKHFIVSIDFHVAGNVSILILCTSIKCNMQM